MKLIGVIFGVMFVLTYLFGNVTLNGMEAHVVKRVLISFVGSFLLGFVIGLPIVGIVSLLR